MKKSIRLAAIAGFALASSALAAPVWAKSVGDGKASFADVYAATVKQGTGTNLGTGTYTAMKGKTITVTATGEFFSAGNSMTTGHMNGTLSFSDIVGTTIDQNVANFFVFGDGKGGNYDFSVQSVTTKSFSPGPSSRGAQLYIIGNTIDTNLGETTPTLTSLSLSFNSTDKSAYSSSATLAIPPSTISAAPEPGVWALMMIGVGMMGAALRFNRRRSGLTFA